MSTMSPIWPKGLRKGHQKAIIERADVPKKIKKEGKYNVMIQEAR